MLNSLIRYCRKWPRSQGFYVRHFLGWRSLHLAEMFSIDGDLRSAWSFSGCGLLPHGKHVCDVDILFLAIAA